MFTSILSYFSSRKVFRILGILALLPQIVLFAQFTGSKWEKTTLLYYIDNGTDDIPGSGEVDAIVAALETWQTAVPFEFLPTAVQSQGDIKFFFRTQQQINTILGNEFGGAIAWTFSDETKPRYGEIYINDDYYFVNNPNPGSNQHDIQAITAHEIGHVLGLADNYSNADLMMYGDASSAQRNLHPDDIANIKARYDWINVENRFTGGTIKVDGIAKNAPYGIIYEVGDIHTLEAVEQINNGISYVWNTAGNQLSISTWGFRRESIPYITPLPTATSRLYNINLQSGHDRNTFMPDLKKLLSINFVTEGDIRVTHNGSSTQYSQTSPTFTVVEQDDIQAEVLPTFGVDNINYYFHHWVNDGSTTNPRTFNPTVNTTYQAVSVGYAYTPNVHFDGNPGDPITIDWDDHPNAAVTQYRVYRMDNIHPEGALIATCNRGNTSYTDYDYQIYDGGTYKRLYYSVIAYYSTDATWSSHNWRTILGEPIMSISSTDGEEAEGEYVTLTPEKKTELKYSLGNSPNPFNPTTQINYTLPETEQVVIKVYNTLGKEVTTLVNEVKSKGAHVVTFNAGNLSSGIYIYTIQTANYAESKKMLLIK